jgi:hypothetical protein
MATAMAAVSFIETYGPIISSTLASDVKTTANERLCQNVNKQQQKVQTRINCFTPIKCRKTK